MTEHDKRILEILKQFPDMETKIRAYDFFQVDQPLLLEMIKGNLLDNNWQDTLQHGVLGINDIHSITEDTYLSLTIHGNIRKQYLADKEDLEGLQREVLRLQPKLIMIQRVSIFLAGLTSFLIFVQCVIFYFQYREAKEQTEIQRQSIIHKEFKKCNCRKLN